MGRRPGGFGAAGRAAAAGAYLAGRSAGRRQGADVHPSLARDAVVVPDAADAAARPPSASVVVVAGRIPHRPAHLPADRLMPAAEQSAERRSVRFLHVDTVAVWDRQFAAVLESRSVEQFGRVKQSRPVELRITVIEPQPFRLWALEFGFRARRDPDPTIGHLHRAGTTQRLTPARGSDSQVLITR